MSGLLYLTVTGQLKIIVELVQRWELFLVWRSRPFLAVAETWMKRRMELQVAGLGFSATQIVL